MISPDFVFLAVVISVAGVSIYARDTVRGLTEPNRVTWLLWTIAPFLAFVSEVRQGVGMTSLMTLTYALCPLVILVASFVNRRSTWQLGPFDIGCGIASCGGLLLWVVTANDTVALVSFIVADLLAGLPTVLKSWRDPSSESPSAFLGGTLSTLLTLATVTTWTSSPWASLTAWTTASVSHRGPASAELAGLSLQKRWSTPQPTVGTRGSVTLAV